MMRAVFLIKSPLQFLNAIEARSCLGYKGEDCLLLLIADRKSRPQLESLVRDDGSWENVVALSEMTLFPDKKIYGNSLPGKRGLFSNDLFAVWKLRFLAKNLNNVERIFIGDMGNPLMRHFANSMSDAESVVLDDGTATLSYAAIRNGALEIKKKLSFGKIIKLGLKRKLMGLRDQEIDAVKFFSVFQLDVKPPDGLLRHDYPHLRKSIGVLERADAIYFLGSPLVEAQILSEDEFFHQLAMVGELLSGKRVVYVAHRRESPGRVEKIGMRLKWETCLFDFPIEYQLARIGPLPRQLTSFFSSALENCQKIFGNDLPITSFKLDLANFSRLKSTKGRQVMNLYEHYKGLESESFRVEPL